MSDVLDLDALERAARTLSLRVDPLRGDDEEVRDYLSALLQAAGPSTVAALVARLRAAEAERDAARDVLREGEDGLVKAAEAAGYDVLTRPVEWWPERLRELTRLRLLEIEHLAVVAERDSARAEVERLRESVGQVLSEVGCDCCDCDCGAVADVHDPDVHDPGCSPVTCLACRVEDALAAPEDVTHG